MADELIKIHDYPRSLLQGAPMEVTPTLEIVQVPMNDLHSAFVVWIWFCKPPKDQIDMDYRKRDFARFLGNATLPLAFGFFGNWELTPYQEQRMRLLFGPHANTLIKAWEAKYGRDVM